MSMNLIRKEDRDAHWQGKANAALKGRKVKNCRYLTLGEAEDMGWISRPLVIEFEDGTYIFASQDDEGNDGGAVFGGNYNNPDGEFTLPVICG